MSSYKKVLPEEKWPLVEHFLQTFCRYANIAEACGHKLDVSKFMSEYVWAFTRERRTEFDRSFRDKLLRDEYRRQGLCTKCGENKPIEGRALCRACAERARRAYARGKKQDEGGVSGGC